MVNDHHHEPQTRTPSPTLNRLPDRHLDLPNSRCVVRHNPGRGQFRESDPQDGTLQETSWYQSLVPGAELVVFEHSSHMPHLEEPQQYQQTLRDFLHRAEGTTKP